MDDILQDHISDLERQKFDRDSDQNTRVRTVVANEAGEPIPVAGTFNISAPTGPFRVQGANITEIASNPIPTPLTARVSLSIRNKGVVAIYIGPDASVTADDTATGGWEIGAGEDFNIDLKAGNAIYLIAPTGQSARIKILEIAST